MSSKATTIPSESPVPSPTPAPSDEEDGEEEDPTFARGPCDEVIQAADAALHACNARSTARDEVIAKQDEAIQTLLKQRQEAIDQIDVKASTPFWLWLIVGIAAGVTLEGARR